MLLMNASDTPIRATWSERNPELRDGIDVYFPPRGWIFEPGKLIDVPDPAGRLFLEHHGNHGLVQANSADDDREELRRLGRRRMFDFLDQYLAEFVRENDDRESMGMFRTPSSVNIRKMLALRNKLDEELHGPQAEKKDMARDLSPTPTSEKKRRQNRATATLDDIEAARAHGDDLSDIG